MRFLLSFVLILLSVSSYGQGIAIRSLNGLGTNITLRANGTNNAEIVTANSFNWGGTGDLNFDGSVDVSDVTALGNMLGTGVTSTNWTVEKFARADLNGDMIVDYTDYIILSLLNAGTWGDTNSSQRVGKMLMGHSRWTDSATNGHYRYQLSIGETVAEPPVTPAAQLYVNQKTGVNKGVWIKTRADGTHAVYVEGTNGLTTIGPNGGVNIGGTNHIGASNLVVQGKAAIGTNTPAVAAHIVQSLAATQALRIDNTNFTPRLQMGTLPGSPSFGSIWFGEISPTASNPTLVSDGASTTYLNTAVETRFTVGLGAQWVLDGTRFYPFADNTEFLGDSTHRIARANIGTLGLTNDGPTTLNGLLGLKSNTIPTVVAGYGYFWPSNYALYWVTPFKTNLITDGN